VIVGAGSAGIGIANQLAATMAMRGVGLDAARRQIWLVDRPGLLVADQPDLLAFQRPFARSRAEVETWQHDGDGRLTLLETVRQIEPHALIGVTGQPGLFTEDVVREMANSAVRPIVMPLSNPTLRAEALPSDVITWTGGRALVGTGSPFGPVEHAGETYPVAQVNNVYVFPGLGLGVIASGATRVTNDMITAASLAVAEFAAAAHTSPELVPRLSLSATVAKSVALAVARQAVAENAAPAATDEQLAAAIERSAWTPRY